MRKILTLFVYLALSTTPLHAGKTEIEQLKAEIEKYEEKLGELQKNKKKQQKILRRLVLRMENKQIGRVAMEECVTEHISHDSLLRGIISAIRYCETRLEEDKAKLRRKKMQLSGSASMSISPRTDEAFDDNEDIFDLDES